WIVAAKVPAGASELTIAPAGECVAIAPGAPLPPGLDSVVPHEWSDRGDRAGRPVLFTVERIELGHAVHPRGADARAGQTLLGKGLALRPHHIGIAAAVGRAVLSVLARPRVALITSGDEVVSPR